jgi:hypothetical protein
MNRMPAGPTVSSCSLDESATEFMAATRHRSSFGPAKCDDEAVRSLPDPGFAGDDGRASAVLAAALAEYADAPDARHAATLLVLQHERVLVPVVSMLRDLEHDGQGRPRDETSDLASVLMTGSDGRKALLAFTSVASMSRWDRDARPVPALASTAAAAAAAEGAAALLLDVAGPVPFVIEQDDLGALAEGYTLVGLGDGYAWARMEPG